MPEVGAPGSAPIATWPPTVDQLTPGEREKFEAFRVDPKYVNFSEGDLVTLARYRPAKQTTFQKAVALLNDNFISRAVDRYSYRVKHFSDRFGILGMPVYLFSMVPVAVAFAAFATIVGPPAMAFYLYEDLTGKSPPPK